MKVRFLKIFLILFILVLPVSVFGVGDGFDPVNIDIPDETGGGYAGHCDLKNVGKTCTANATKSKASMGICRNYSGTPSCAAQECNKGYYLWLDSKGNSQGVCHSLEEAQKRCDKNKTLCSNGEVFSPNIVPNPKLTDKLKALGGQQQAWKGCVCQPNCEGVYRDNIEALTCCKYENATWDKKQGRCNCTQEGYNWKYSNGQGECVPPEQPVVPNKEPCPDGATGDIPNCQCGGPKSKYVLETNSCECPDDKPVFENGQCIAPTKCPDGATGTPPNCQCGGSKSKYVLETNSCECPDDRPTFENGQCIAPTKCPDGATGTPPNCQCGGPKSKYVLETNSCECPDDKPVFENGQCIAVVQKPECPKDATGTPPNCKCTDSKKIYDKNKNQCVSNKLEELKQQYEDAKANEQSTANRRLTALTTAATGIGGMELAQGIAEKSADKDAQLNMDAYIATMRCTYGNGKSVKASLSEVELPGGNDATIMQYRNEYMTLASDLKQRKESLGMKPGIESEVIYDKSTMGLYDEENVGISGGNYASLYRAKMLGSEEDQTKITEEQSKAANRLKYGAIAAGAGVAVGIVGNSVINGKIGEKIKEIKNNINYRRKEESVLKDLKQCLKDAGATNVDKLKFNKFTPSLLNLDNIDCKKDLTNIRGNDATTLFSDSDDGETITNKLVNSFGEENAKSMLGDVITNRGDFGVGQKYCGLSVEGALVPVRTSATPWNRCDELKKGEWRVEFAGEQYLEGVSVCSATGVSADVDDNGVFSDDVVPEESLQTKIQQDYDSWVAEGRQDVSYLQLPRRMGCYCKTDQIGAKWVFNYVGSPSGCKTNCAWDCGSRQTGTKIDGKVDFTKTLVTGVHTIYRE